jgi:hypothetical protein
MSREKNVLKYRRGRVRDVAKRLGLSDRVHLLAEGQPLPKGLGKSPVSNGCINPLARRAFLHPGDNVNQMFHEMMHLVVDPNGFVTVLPEQLALLQVERRYGEALLEPYEYAALLRDQRSSSLPGRLYPEFSGLPWWGAGLDLGVRIGLLEPGTYAPTFRRANWAGVDVRDLIASAPALPWRDEDLVRE